MTDIAQFLSMTFLSSKIETDENGNLVRVESRRCDRTGLKLTARMPVPASKEYLASANA